MHLYVSFARIDEPYALDFVRVLQRYHTVSHDDRLFAADWWQTALMRLGSCDALFYLISPESAAAEYCRRECEVMQQAGHAVIPILIVDGAPVLLMLEGYTMLDLRSGIDKAGEKALVDLLGKITPPQKRPVTDLEAAKRPFEVQKDDPGTLITDANQEALEENWEKAVYLIRSALATGFTSQLVDVHDLLHDAEAELLALQYERHADRAYAALRRDLPIYDISVMRPRAREFARRFPGYDPDEILAQVGVVTQASAPSQAPRNLLDYWRQLPQENRTILIGVVSIALVIIWLTTNLPRLRTLSPIPTPTIARPTATRQPAATTTPQSAVVVDMRLIAGGCFEMGSPNYDQDERPVHTVCVESFWLDRYEVSHAQFARYGGRARESTSLVANDFPRNNISWTEAHTFCLQRDARLPTEEEWEYAASWGGRLTYPWGDVFQGARTNSALLDDDYDDIPAPVAAFRNYATPDGIVNLAGNVAEWVSSAYRPYPYNDRDGRERQVLAERVTRGGSFRDFSVNLRSADRDPQSQDYASDDLGFRCARNA